MARILQQGGQSSLGGALGGGIANVLGAMQARKQFGGLVNAFAPQGQQQQLNIEALRKVTDPNLQRMIAQMLLQRHFMGQLGGNFGVLPGEFQYLTPQERRQATVRKHLQGQDTDVRDKLREWQIIYGGTQRKGDLGDQETIPGQERTAKTALRQIKILQKQISQRTGRKAKSQRRGGKPQTRLAAMKLDPATRSKVDKALANGYTAEQVLASLER